MNKRTAHSDKLLDDMTEHEHNEIMIIADENLGKIQHYFETLLGSQVKAMKNIASAKADHMVDHSY